MPTSPAPALIAADWGTSNFRMFLLDANGHELARHTAPIGLKALDGRTFEDALTSVLTGPFDRPDLPILMAGMVGSKQGWIEAPYITAPAGLDTLGAALTRAPSDRLKAYIVPGVCYRADTGVMSVMRGEEAQIAGLIGANAALSNGTFVLPGTHSKWTRIETGHISAFRTHMTGEMYQLLKTHSILGALMNGDEADDDAFALGVERALEDPAFLSLIFSTRTEGLFGRLPPEALAAYLSGLLIGSEIGAEYRLGGTMPVHLIGDDRLTALYEQALKLAGLTEVTRHSGEDCAIAGLFALARHGGLV